MKKASDQSTIMAFWNFWTWKSLSAIVKTAEGVLNGAMEIQIH